MPLMSTITCTRLPSHRSLFGECLRVRCGPDCYLLLCAHEAVGTCRVTVERFGDDGAHEVIYTNREISRQMWDSMQATDPTSLIAEWVVV